MRVLPLGRVGLSVPGYFTVVFVHLDVTRQCAASFTEICAQTQRSGCHKAHIVCVSSLSSLREYGRYDAHVDMKVYCKNVLRMRNIDSSPCAPLMAPWLGGLEGTDIPDNSLGQGSTSTSSTLL